MLEFWKLHLYPLVCDLFDCFIIIVIIIITVLTFNFTF